MQNERALLDQEVIGGMWKHSNVCSLAVLIARGLEPYVLKLLNRSLARFKAIFVDHHTYKHFPNSHAFSIEFFVRFLRCVKQRTNSTPRHEWAGGCFCPFVDRVVYFVLILVHKENMDCCHPRRANLVRNLNACSSTAGGWNPICRTRNQNNSNYRNSP